jgi:PBSX family phage terminase large subunit
MTLTANEILQQVRATEAYKRSEFTPFPWQVDPWRFKGSVLLLTGSAGGGKSRVAAEKLHGFCQKYPNAMALALRKTRESMKNSTVLFLERVIVGTSDARVNHSPSKNRFEYDNGSILAYGGMKDEDQREQIRSIGIAGGVDICWMEEATMFEEDDFNEILARMRGKAAGWNQVILTTNPDSPQHWINQRLIIPNQWAVGQQGRCRMSKKHHTGVWYSSALDNPSNPSQYIENLQLLTGVAGQRLRDGLWVQAENAVYPNFGDHNISEQAEYNPEIPVFWAVDDGFTQDHPRCILFVHEMGENLFYIFDEMYRAYQVGEETIAEAMERSITWHGDIYGNEYLHPIEKQIRHPEAAYLDPSAVEFANRLWSQDIDTVRPRHHVEQGISRIQGLLRDGMANVSILIHPRCTRLIAEFQSYAREPKTGKPLKKNDHGPDALRYLSWGRRVI